MRLHVCVCGQRVESTLQLGHSKVTVLRSQRICREHRSGGPTGAGNTCTRYCVLIQYSETLMSTLNKIWFLILHVCHSSLHRQKLVQIIYFSSASCSIGLLLRLQPETYAYYYPVKEAWILGVQRDLYIIIAHDKSLECIIF